MTFDGVLLYQSGLYVSGSTVCIGSAKRHGPQQINAYKVNVHETISKSVHGLSNGTMLLLLFYWT